MFNRSIAVFAVVALACSGCYRTTVTPAHDAEAFGAPSSTVTLTRAAPAKGILLGTIEEHGNNSKRREDQCLERLERDAKEIGATHLVRTTPTDAGDWLYFGARCAGRAYRAEQ
jgi:hypothetical protein